MTDERFRQRLREHLDAGFGDVPADVARRLQQARVDALAAGARWHPPAWWKPAGALVLAGLLVVAVIFRLPGGEGRLPATAMDADLELIAADDSLQFYEELDFYQWLVSEDGASDAG